jgi:hypothetical protein
MTPAGEITCLLNRTFDEVDATALIRTIGTL